MSAVSDVRGGSDEAKQHCEETMLFVQKALVAQSAGAEDEDTLEEISVKLRELYGMVMFIEGAFGPLEAETEQERRQ